MTVSLLDVNVLVALFDPGHVHHEAAHQWFGSNHRDGWATCAITLNGAARILCNRAYLRPVATVEAAVSLLKALCAAPEHEFWPDDISLLDSTRFRPALMEGHQKITDAYLLGLAVHRGGRFVTFDRSIPLKTVIGAEAHHMRVLGLEHQ
jgi:toxin-antitoxin system PIN domain toxin